MMGNTLWLFFQVIGTTTSSGSADSMPEVCSLMYTVNINPHEFVMNATVYKLYNLKGSACIAKVFVCVYFDCILKLIVIVIIYYCLYIYIYIYYKDFISYGW